MFLLQKEDHNQNALMQDLYFYRGNNEGFTIIELMIVIIVIGILSAISLPSFMNQASKAQQSEAKAYIGSMNRAQQAEYVEEGKFTTKLSLLGLGISPETAHYIYKISESPSEGANVVNRAIPSDGTFSDTPGDIATVSAYLGGVKLGKLSDLAGSASTLIVLCEALKRPIEDGDSGIEAEPENLSYDSLGPPTCNLEFYKAIK